MKLKLNRVSHAALALLILAAAQAQAQSQYPYVDHYKNNEGVVTINGVANNYSGIVAGSTSANHGVVAGTRTSRTQNPTMALLKGHDTLWTPGSSWNNGTLTAAGEAVMRANQAYVVSVTNNRTAAQAEYAYLADRRHQSYSAIDGLGSFADGYRAQAGAFTTITAVGPQALIGKYDERGNGAGLRSSATVGQVVHLAETLRGFGTSSNPSKEAFNSPRPWRLNDGFQVLQTGTESVGYFTSTNADGSPNTTLAPTFFPNYATSVRVVPELLAARSTTPSSDGGFVSGHTNAAYLASFAMAYAMPEQYKGLMLNASNMGDSRIVAGMHLPLDVVGGRMLATGLAVGILNTNLARNGQGIYQDMAALKSDARQQGRAFIANNAVAERRFAEYESGKLADNRANRDLYSFRLTYGLPNTNAVGAPAVVPKGAEVLLETRHSYLNAEQRREVLRTTAIASGGALTDDDEGYGRLNLYAAADGYGRFDSRVTVTMDAARGGFEARDQWHNNISGTGGLTKAGTGELGLTGANTYSGGTDIMGGTLVAASATALGSGDVSVGNGATLVNFAPDALRIGGNYTQLDGGSLEMVIGQGSDGLMRGMLDVAGRATLDGTLRLTFLENHVLGSLPTYFMRFGSSLGSFDAVNISGLAGGYKISYLADGLQIAAVPVPGTWTLLVAGLGALAWSRRRA